MTPLGLIVMRRTATLLHAVPGLRARLVHGGRVLLEVTQPTHPVAAPSGRWRTPRAFRVAVGRAVEATRAGKSLAVLGLEPRTDPAVELGAPHGVLLAGGIVHLPTVTGGELAFATTAPAELIETTARAEGITARCRVDALTEATLVVHTIHATRPEEGSDALCDALASVQSLLASCAVYELIEDVDAFVPRASRPDPR